MVPASGPDLPETGTSRQRCAALCSAHATGGRFRGSSAIMLGRLTPMLTAIARRRSIAALSIAGLTLAGLGITGASAAASSPLHISPTGPEPFTSAVNGPADIDTRATVAPLASQRSA